MEASDLQTAKAWTAKKHLRHLWAMTSMDTARDYAIAWARAAKDTGFKPVIAVADLVLNHLDQIINFARNSVTNAGAEGINLKNAAELVNPPERLLLSNFSCLSWPPIWCPENADVVQLQGAQCAGMAHAISSFVQRRTPQAGRSCVFQDQQHRHDPPESRTRLPHLADLSVGNPLLVRRTGPIPDFTATKHQCEGNPQSRRKSLNSMK